MGDALALLAGMRLEDGRPWGDVAEPFQWADAGAILSADVSAPRMHYVTRPRGASKTSDLGGVALAALIEQLPRASRSYAFAADRDQAALLVDSIGGFVSRTGLRSLVKVDAYKVTNKRTAARLDVMSADDASAWGLRPHLTIVDEYAQWRTTGAPRRLWEAIFSGVAKVPGSRLAILTSAGDPASPAFKLLERARASDAWRVSETPGPCPWIGAEALAEQRAELSESQYRRLHLNEWVASEGRLTSVEDLRACVTLDGPLRPVPGIDYVIGADLGITNDRTVVAVCHAEATDVEGVRFLVSADERERVEWGGYDPLSDLDFSERPVRGRRVQRGSPERGVRIVLDRMQVWQGSRGSPVKLSEVEEWILQASQAFNGASLIFDPWQSVGMAQRLHVRGVRTEEFTFSSGSVGRLASTMHLLLRNRALALPDDPELLDELANVRLRETSPGVVRMDHDAGHHDDRALALGLAAHQLLESAPSRPLMTGRVLDRRHGSGRRAR